MQVSTEVYLKNSTGLTRNGIALVEYIWEPIKGKVEEDPEGNLEETWIDERLIINFTAIVDPEDATSDFSTEFILNEFLGDKGKEFKENSWSSYIDVVVTDKKVRFRRTKDSAKLGTVSFTLAKKTKSMPAI